MRMNRRSALFFLLFSITPFSYADKPIDYFDRYISCSRNSEVRVVIPKIYNKKTCDATAVIQGIAYKCGRPEEENLLRSKFLSAIIERGKTRCDEFCSEMSSDCTGKFEPPLTCFYPQTADIQGMGKDFGCSPACEGTAFIYCSIYQASYLRYDEDLFVKKIPNCSCEKKPAK